MCTFCNGKCVSIIGSLRDKRHILYFKIAGVSILVSQGPSLRATLTHSDARPESNWSFWATDAIYINSLILQNVYSTEKDVSILLL